MISKVEKNFLKYSLFVTNGMQVILRYRINFFMTIASNALVVATKFFLWQAIYQNRNDIVLGGFDLKQIITYALITPLIELCIDTRADSEITREVMKGEIAINLIRPINYFALRFFNELARVISTTAFVVVPTYLVIIYLFPSVRTEMVNLLFFVMSIILAFLVNFFISIFIGIIAFWTTNTWGLQLLRRSVVNFFSGQVLPLTFFGGLFGKVVDFLPFRAIVFSPMLIYMGKYQGGIGILQILGGQLAWVIALWLVCFLFWRRGIKRLVVLGG
jgi:ABC-2 type transport system permease protein